MARPRWRRGATCVVLLLVGLTGWAQELQTRAVPGQPVEAARGWALSAAAPADAQVPELITRGGAGVRIVTANDVAVFRPAFRLREPFTIGVTFERTAGADATAAYGFVARIRSIRPPRRDC